MTKLTQEAIAFYRPLNLSPLKKCHRCGEWKPLHLFQKNRQSKDGLRPSCKPCTHRMNAEAMVRRRALREALAENKRAHAAVDSALSNHINGAEIPPAKRIHPHLLLAVLFLLAAVALTGYALGRLTYKAETRDWSTVHVPRDQS